MPLTRIASSSVVTLAYDQIRAMVLDGDLAPGDRLHQVDLADQLGVSRTPVREALRRLAGEGLVEFREQRGFRVAELVLDDVQRRLEVRLLLEPGGARLAAARRTDGDLEAMQATIDAELAAQDAAAVHDASRGFHVALAAASQNRELVLTLEGLWLTEVGRRLLARRDVVPEWRRGDAGEHRAILAAVRERDADAAERLTREHVRAALRHWGGDLQGLGA